MVSNAFLAHSPLSGNYRGSSPSSFTWPLCSFITSQWMSQGGKSHLWPRIQLRQWGYTTLWWALELEPCRFVVEVGAKPTPQVSSSVGLERQNMHRENKLVWEENGKETQRIRGKKPHGPGKEIIAIPDTCLFEVHLCLILAFLCPWHCLM